MEQANVVISDQSGKDGKERRFSWWLGLGLFVGSAVVAYTGLYLWAMPRVGEPMPQRSVWLVAPAQATVELLPDGSIHASWSVYNDGRTDLSTLDSIAIVPLTKGLDLIPLNGGIGHQRAKTISTLLPGDTPADAAWQFQGLDGPIPGGRLALGGPHGMTLYEWQEILRASGKNYAEPH